jgi:RHS repeat-associated protein
VNRLTETPGVGRFEYDGHGRRTVTWRADGTAKVDFYTVDGKVRYKTDNWEGGGTDYIYLGDQLVAERKRPWRSARGTVYTHTDHLGSPVLRTTVAAQVYSRDRRVSFGAPLTLNPVEAEAGYTGHIEDPEQGLVYMQQRYYDPAIARFLSVDPVGPLEDARGHFGRYHYALNNPYRFTDPDERCPTCVVGAAIGVGLDLVVQVTEVGMGSREEISGASLVISAASGALGVGLAGKFGQIGGVITDAAISAGSTAAKGEAVTALGVAADVAFGKAGSAAAARSITGSPGHKNALRKADRLERIGSKSGARKAQQERAKAAGTALQQSVAQKSAQAGVVASGVGSAGARQVERKLDEEKPR